MLKKAISAIVFWRRSADEKKESIFLPNNIGGMGFTLSGNLYVRTDGDYSQMPAFGTRNTITKPSEVKTSGNFFNISVRLVVPNALYLFTKIPVNTIYEQESVDLEHIFEKRALNELNDRLLETDTDLQRLHIIETFLWQRIINSCPPMLTVVIEFINETKGVYNLEVIAKRFSITERTINRYFNRFIGISPSQYIQLIRFRSVINKRDIKDKNFLNIALDAGYYDQSHFIKHCKEFSKVTPRKFYEMFEKRDLSDFYNL